MSEGAICETSATATFTLTATDGYISTPDGNAIYMWGYAGSSGSFQLPGPTLCVTAGDTVTIVLRNQLPERVSIMFPGQIGVLADGRPVQPEWDTDGTLTSLTTTAAARNGTVTYSFVASDPGTFLYESGSDQAKQVQMGLYGALIVRPAGHADWAYDDASTHFNSSHEYLHLLSEIDPAMHLAVERGKTFDLTKYRARYFLINGRSMPDTIAPNNAPWLPAQPYGAMVHVRPNSASNPLPSLIRYVSVGTAAYPFHPHGNSQRVIAQDGMLLRATDGKDMSYDKFLMDVTPGSTVDTLLTWTEVEGWDPQTNPIPVEVPPLNDQLIGPGTDTWFSESPYLGHTGDLPPGFTNFNECGEYYHVAHSHALQQATNYGVSFGGMMTLIRIDPPDGCPVAQ
jgi:FtsP/CotA-like multicopper oxidase with cupredoxin domain